MHLNGEKMEKCHFLAENLLGMSKWAEYFMLMRTFGPRGLFASALWLNTCTVQPHYNAPHYSAVFNITRPWHGSQINYFAICLL